MSDEITPAEREPVPPSAESRGSDGLGSDAVDAAFIKSLMPDDAIPIGCFAIVAWMDPVTAHPVWRTYTPLDMPTLQIIGMLEVAKRNMTEQVMGDGPEL